MADQTLRAYAVDRGAWSRGARRSAGAATGIVAHLAAAGLLAAATAGVFLGTGYFLLLHPQHELLAKANPGTSPEPAAVSTVRPAEPGPIGAKPVPSPITAVVAPTPVRDAVANKSVLPPIAANPAPISAPAPAAASPEATTTLPPAEIAALLRNGEASFRTGDVDSARLFYRRAAEAGDAQAALRLGATFDPAMLSRGRLRNHFGDRSEARLWYLRAYDMGAAEAPNRLVRLAKEAAR
ncbi:MAG: hypothetical protein ACREET_10265 [Stellaceae bacterium]